MCHMLYQVYACGDRKEVCITPCPHAIETAGQTAPSHDNRDLSRSGSGTSSLAPSTNWTVHNPEHSPPPTYSSAPQSPVMQAPTTLSHSLSNCRPLPPRAESPGGLAARDLAPAFRFIAPGQNRISSPPPPPPGYPSLDRPSPTSPTPTTPKLSAGSPRMSIGSVFTFPPEPIDPTPAPNYCGYYFPRDLPRSLVPCINCYMDNRWVELRKRWMETYVVSHPTDKIADGDIEEMSGVKAIREQMERGGFEL